MQCNKHVVKMIVESAQMLSTNHRVLNGEMYYGISKKGRKVKRWRLDDDYLENNLYMGVHVNHPCTVWARKSADNYNWLYEHFIALCDEYTHRYGKIHKTDRLLRYILKTLPKGIPDIGLTDYAVAMEKFAECKVKGNPVESYRNFYVTKKERFKLEWSVRETPEWYLERINKELLTS